MMDMQKGIWASIREELSDLPEESAPTEAYAFGGAS
jgi:hypothetical protein